MKCRYPIKIVSLLIFFLANWSESFGQSSRLRFNQISIKQGLSQNTVNTIVQDTLGFIWLGTRYGLNKYDGENFTVFFANRNQRELSGNQIRELYRDSQGNIWVGTDRGLYRYDYLKDDFHFVPETKNLSVIKLQEFKSSRLLALTEQGLFIYEEDSLSERLLPHLNINDIAVTNNELWIASSQGIYSYKEFDINYEVLIDEENLTVLHQTDSHLFGGNKNGQLFEIQNHTLVSKFSINDFEITSIQEASEKQLWIGSKTEGIVMLDLTNYDIKDSVYKNPYVPNSLPSNKILTLYKDEYDDLWVGTEGGGAAIAGPDKEKFTTFYHDPYDSTSLPNSDIFSISEDLDGNIWLGSSASYLIKLELNEQQFRTFQDPILGNRPLSCVFVDRKNRIWLGNNRGLFLFYPGSGSFKWVSSELKEIRVITESPDGKSLWIGTSGHGIYEWDVINSKILTHLNKNNDLKSNNIYSLLIKDEVLYVGTENRGLQQIDLENRGIITEFQIPQLSNTKILSILSDPTDPQSLWLGTSGQGLVNIQIDEDNKLERINAKDGLFNVVYGMLPDSQDNLWISSNNGLGRFSIRDRVYTHQFDESFGLQSDEFNGHAYFLKNQEEGETRMYFGGINGLTFFNPDSIILPENREYPIRFTGLSIDNQRIPVGEQLPSNIAMLESLKVGDDDLPITLNFRQLRYDRRSILYDLVVHDVVKNKSEHFKNYTDESYVFNVSMRPWKHWLVPDTYEVKVIPHAKGDSYSLNSSTLTIKVAPPFWMWNWVRLLTVLAFFGSIWILLYIIRIRRARASHLEKLRGLTLQINEISRLKDGKALGKKCLQDIIEFFEFDFVTISHINYIKERIEITDWQKRGDLRQELFLGNWVQEVNKKSEEGYYPLDDKGADVLQLAWRTKNPVIVDGHKIQYQENIIRKSISKPFEGEYPTLNKQIFDRYDHQNLVSVCMPVIRRMEKAEQDYVSAIIGAGYHRKTKTKISRQERIELEIYADNFAQAYYWALTEKGRKERSEFLKSLDNESHHLIYLVKFLRKIADFFQCEDTCFVFPLHQNDYVCYDNNHTIEPHVTIPIPFKNAKDRIKNYYTLFQIGNEKQLGLWGQFENKEWGSFYYKRPKPLNKIQENAIRKTLNEFQEKFQLKKQRYLKDRLVEPFNIFSEKETIHRQLIKILYLYFGCEYIGLWEVDQTSRSLRFAFGTKELRSIDNVTSVDIAWTLQNGEYFKEKAEVLQFSETDPLHHKDFNSLVTLPIHVDRQLHSGILFYTSKQHNFLLPQDYDFVNALCNKYAAFIPAFNLSQAFPTVLNSFPSNREFGEEDKNNILESIMEQALKVFNADLIQLYEFEKEHQHLKSAPTDKGIYINPDTKKHSLKARKLSDESLKFIKSNANNIWVLENEHEFNQFKSIISKEQNEKLFQEDFWHKEQIQTLFIGRLMNRDNFLGVIFYMFRRTLLTIDESKKLMEPFHDLASRAILTSNIHKIAYGEVDKRVQEAADILNSHAYYLLSRGINHDVRNLLQIMVRHEHQVKRLVFKELSPDDQKAYDEKIDRIDEVTDRIESLLDLYKVDSIKQQEIAINRPIRDIIRFVEHQMGDKIHFVTQLVEPSPEIYGDLNIFTMILYNLLTNAVKAILAKQYKALEGSISVASILNDKILIIQVTDNGIGMSDLLTDDIYQPYFSGVQDKGVGFGLFFTREMLKQKFAGTISYESKIGQGTTFSIEFPLT